MFSVICSIVLNQTADIKCTPGTGTLLSQDVDSRQDKQHQELCELLKDGHLQDIQGRTVKIAVVMGPDNNYR
jgi:hypothetical protein